MRQYASVRSNLRREMDAEMRETTGGHPLPNCQMPAPCIQIANGRSQSEEELGGTGRKTLGILAETDYPEVVTVTVSMEILDEDLDSGCDDSVLLQHS